MGRAAPEMDLVHRGIVFLCQECHGDLEPVQHRGRYADCWECRDCGCLWVYTERGWERLTR